MTRKQRPLSGFISPGVATLAIFTWLVLGVCATAQAQGHSRRPPNSGSSGGQTTQSAPPPQASAPSGTRAESGATARGESSHSGQDSGRTGHAVPRGGEQPDRGGNTDTARPGTATITPETIPADASSGDSNDAPTFSRPREGRNATGEAVERRPDSNGGNTGGGTVGGYHGGGLYPWGYGGLGFGGYYGAGYYDPWWDDPYGQSSSYGDGYLGSLKLKVKPREASVYVDGYFAGRVDDFDGFFQRLRIEPGPHRIELRLDGFEPLLVDLHIQPDRTLTYSGELKPLP